jgi:hypothetical protein
MNPILEPPPAPPRRRRFILAFRLSQNSETRAIQIGVLGTLLIHLLILLLAPSFLQVKGPKSPLRRAAPQTFSIEIAPDAFKKAPPPPPKHSFKFVEANPNAPDNVPDKTENVSFMNQQVAQERASKNTPSDKPKIEGRKDVQSTQIVDGRLTKPEEVVPPAPPAQTLPPSAAVPKREQNPLSGDEKQKGTDIDGFGSNYSKVAPNPQPIPDAIKGVKDAPLVEGATGLVPQIDPHHPMPRRTLQQQHVRPAIFQDNEFGTSNVGPTAYNAKWSNYGVYMQRLIETVQVSWDNIIDQSNIRPSSGTIVTVTFVLNSKGEIARIVKHTPDGQAPAIDACMSGITNPAPYGPWTDDMIAVLGTDQEITFTFYYE